MFDPMQFVFNPQDPRKPPELRHLRARYLLEHSRAPRPRDDDESTRRVWEFYGALRRCRGDNDRDELARDFPALAAAHEIYSGSETMRRAELEARLLAGEDDETIALKMVLTPAAVAAYHEVYYLVRPRLNAGVHVLGLVYGDRDFCNPDPGDHPLLLRLLGHQLGGAVVDALLEYWRDPPVVPKDLRGLDEGALRRLMRKVRLRLHLLVTTTPAEALDPLAWLNLRAELAAVREMAGGAGGGGDQVLPSLHAALDVAAALADAAAPSGDARAA
jgi:hypothetical protein